jgi:hypothetical protein
MKKLFFITTILFSVHSFAQKAITSDNKKLDSLTSSFKTYSVILVVNDSVSEDPVKSDIIVELQRNYPFLKKKKMKPGETDFSILVNIKGIAIGKPDHRVTSRDDRYVTHHNHDYSLDHVVSTGLVVSSKGTDLITIYFGSDVIVKKHYYYTETVTDYKWRPDQSKWAATETRSSKLGARLSELWRFEKDFFELFNSYKSAKL